MSEQQSPTSVDSKKVLPPLNPLALPAETDGLFRMLVAGSFLLTMYMLMLYIVFGVLLGVPWFFADVWWNTQAFELTSQTIADRWIFALSDGEMRELAASLAWLNLGAFFNSLPRVAFVMLFGCVLMLTSVILYRSGFARMIRRDKLRTLSTFPRTDLAARVQAHISTIARSAGFERAPEIVVRTSKKGDAQVFGHRGRYILRVDAAPSHALSTNSVTWCAVARAKHFEQ